MGAPACPSRPRPFAAYLATQWTWFFAFGLQTALFPYVVRKMLGASETAVGLAQTALTAPVLFLIAFGGVVAERSDRRALMTLLHVAALVPPTALAFLILTGGLAYWAIIAYGLGMGVIGAIMMPTRDAALNAAASASPAAFPVQRAVVLASLAQFLGQLGGMVAASAAELVGPAPLIFCQAGAIALGLAAALRMPPLPPPPGARPARVLSQLGEGFAIVWSDPAARALTLAMAAIGVFVIGGGFLVLLPLLVLDGYRGGPSELGLTLAIFWLGAAASTVALARIGHVGRPGLAFVGALGVGSATLAWIATGIPLWGLLALVFVWGAASGVGIAMSRAIIQEVAPPQALGRVLSIYQLGFMGGAPLGALLHGALADAVGPRLAALSPMLGVLATALWLLLATPLRRYEGGRGAL